MPGTKQNEKNQNDQAYPAYGIKTPLLAVRPDRQTADNRYQNKDRKDNHYHHVFFRLQRELSTASRGSILPPFMRLRAS
jgi:hypothetical protein